MESAKPPSRDRPERLLYDVEEVMVLLGIGRSKLYTYLLSGQLRSLRQGRRRKIPVDAVHEFRETLSVES